MTQANKDAQKSEKIMATAATADAARLVAESTARKLNDGLSSGDLSSTDRQKLLKGMELIGIALENISDTNKAAAGSTAVKLAGRHDAEKRRNPEHRSPVKEKGKRRDSLETYTRALKELTAQDVNQHRQKAVGPPVKGSARVKPKNHAGRKVRVHVRVTSVGVCMWVRAYVCGTNVGVCACEFCVLCWSCVRGGMCLVIFVPKPKHKRGEEAWFTELNVSPGVNCINSPSKFLHSSVHPNPDPNSDLNPDPASPSPSLTFPFLPVTPESRRR